MGNKLRQNSIITKTEDLSLLALTAIGRSEFERCFGISKLLIPEGVLSYKNCFYQSNNIVLVVLPTTIDDMQDAAVLGKNAVRTNIPYDVLIKANKIPTASFNISYYAPDLRYIYVPDNLLEEYRTADYWSSVSAKYKGYSELPDEYKQYWP